MLMDEIKLKKQWLQVFLITVGYRLLITVLDSPRNLELYSKEVALIFLGGVILFAVLHSLALYNCAYRKPGTKVLTIFMVLMAYGFLVGPTFLFFEYQKLPTWFLLSQVVDFALGIWWFKLSLSLRKLNKKLQNPALAS